MVCCLVRVTALVGSGTWMKRELKNPMLHSIRTTTRLYSSAYNSSTSSQKYGKSQTSKGNLLILGGTGFLGSEIIKRAVMEGYSVTSISRKGNDTAKDDQGDVQFIKGDARDPSLVKEILQNSNEPYVGVVHSLGLLLDGKSGLGKYNRFASGSGSVPDPESTYDDITRKTAYYAIDAAQQYSQGSSIALPFVFISCAEAGWPDVPGGSLIENNLAPEWLQRYLAAKRAVESKLMGSYGPLRPIIFRPSLIFSYERLPSLPPVGAFFLGNAVGLPFVDRPVTVQALAAAVVNSLSDVTVSGVQRYKDIDDLSSK